MGIYIVKSFVRVSQIAVLMLLFSGCHRWRHTRKKAPILPQKKYTLTVTGVECRQCVLSVLPILEKAKGVKNAVCHCKAKQYQTAQFVCTTPVRADFLFEPVAAALAKRDFVLHTITGDWIGELVLGEHEEIFFTPHGAQQKYTVKAEAPILAEIRERARLKPIAQLYGTLYVDTKELQVGSG